MNCLAAVSLPRCLAVAAGLAVCLALSLPLRADDAADKKAKEDALTATTVELLAHSKPLPAEGADAKSEAEMKPYTETLPGTELKFEMVPIKGGTYLLGSPGSEAGRKDDEGPQVEVTVEPFWMGKCEVTWDEYETYSFKLDIQRRKASNTPATFWDAQADVIARPTNPYTDMTFGMGKDKKPAICMTQYAAQHYCKWLSTKTGRYYRLPTESEWEYAARAGSKTAYSFGDDPKKLEDYGWFYDNSEEKYHKVGQKKPNAWGLYDMHGNVCEWVLDLYDAGAYKKYAAGEKPVKNAFTYGPPEKEYPRAVRGGSWDDDAEACRSAARRGSHKDWKMQDPQIPQSIWYLTDATFVGFRVIRPLHVPSVDECKKFDPNPAVVLEYRKAQGGKE
jgi:formylglycine-generating enzyme required for sulfatase activity